MLLCPIEERGEADGRLSSGVVLRVRLGDGCVVYLLGLLFTVLLLCIPVYMVVCLVYFCFNSVGYVFLLLCLLLCVRTLTEVFVP
jgi:uncharacterized membrane protein